MKFAEAHNHAQGRWHSILQSLGIPVPDHPQKHSPCPGCGGVDRFRFDDRDGKGTFYCNGAGDVTAGDGFALIQHVLGCSPGEALKMVTEQLGNTQIPRRRVIWKKPPPRTGQRRRGLELWMAADRTDDVVAAHPYCQRKGIGHAFGAGVAGDLLLIPIRIDGTGKVISVQTINPNGDKRTYGAMENAFLLLGNEQDPRENVYLVEGWADAFAVLTVRPAAACAMAFGKGRMDMVAQLLVRAYPDKLRVIYDG